MCKVGKGLNYLDFKQSVDSMKVHWVSALSFELNVECDEPVYGLKTSGSTSSKVYLHKLSGLRAAAESFLLSFPLAKTDCWGICLSTKHVAGFSILARTYFGGIKEPHEFEWSAKDLVSVVDKNLVTVLSLVPTQIFDLVSLKIKAPKGLKHVFVGGAFISQDLILKAKGLGWPLVMCYGSTETFAQMSYSLDGLSLKPFKGWELDTDNTGELSLKGPGLYWAEVSSELLIRDENEWFKTGDLVSLKGEGEFTLLGKLNGLVKIKGSYFNFNEFKKNFRLSLDQRGLSSEEFFPVVLEEERNGAGVYLICRGSLKNSDILLSENSEFRGVFKIVNDILSVSNKVDKLKLEGELSRTVVSL